MTRLLTIAALAVFVPTTALAQVRVVSDVDYVAGAEYPDKKDRLDIYVPQSAATAPVIVSFYGGGLRQGDKSGHVKVGERFAQAGYVTVVANYRLSPSVMHPAHVQDAAAAVAWVKKNIARHNGDPDRIFVIGHSAGAYLAALLATDARYLSAHGLTPGDVRGYAPVSAFFYVNRPGVAPDRPKDVWGIDANVWIDASPGAHIAAGAPPMLLLYADGDDDWRRNQQGEFAGALRIKGNRDVEVKMIAKRTHNSIWSEMMASADDETTRAILEFTGRLARRPSSRDR
jgi:acetyl esterase/lipase